jgi:serine/threonine protein kinase
MGAGDGKPLDETMRVDPAGATLGLPPISGRPHSRQRDVPTRFGRYEVRSLLGSGGMGTVYLAYDTQLDRLVALKVPHQEGDDDPELLQRFVAEAQAAAGIAHPNLCTVHDVGEIGGIPYLTMNYVRGRPLTELLADGQPLPQEQAALIVQQVAAAMDTAHKAGIVHRDLKPANIIIGEHDAPVVMDFGVARRESSARRRLTHQGTSLGTPGYMAPEAMRGDAVGAPADIYSLGVTLYQLLTAHMPFPGTPVETVRRVLRGDRAQAPDELRPGIDPQLVAICQKAMAQSISDRFATMGELAEALVELLRGKNRQFQLAEDEPTSDLGNAEVLSRAGQQLFLLGRWNVAYDVISIAANLPGLDTLSAIRQRNRIVYLCKSMDRWPVGLEHAEWCYARLPEDTPADLAARVCVNRGSVLYDIGRRSEAGEAFQEGRRYASNGRTSRVALAAANNDLGVFHHYADDLTRAESVLTDGRNDVEEHPLVAAYLDTNLGLVHITRSFGDPVYFDSAARILSKVLERFTAAGHLQGISYALSNRAICDLAAGRLREARDAFEETIRLGERLGEKWTAYGAMANLALVELARPGGDPVKAYELASEAALRALANNDPKGVGDASLIAGRAALDGGAPLSEGDVRLDDAAQRFARLGQRLGEALACFGRMEIASVDNAERASAFEQRARAILAETELPRLPAKFVAPPWHMLLLMELF